MQRIREEKAQMLIVQAEARLLADPFDQFALDCVDLCRMILPVGISERNRRLDFFARFWRRYPNKVGKEMAKRVILKLPLDAEMQRHIMYSLEQDIRTIWRETLAMDDRSKIPHAATWLNNERWLDHDPPEDTEHACER